MKAIFIVIFIINSLLAIDQKEYLMNNVKSLIQKEEYLALAINRYILQTGKIPKNSDSQIDWDVLEKGYLDKSFTKKNPYMNSDSIIITFDTNNNAFIKGIIGDKDGKFKKEHNYLYNFYTNSSFRVNTIPPKNTEDENLEKGTQVLYSEMQKDIAKILKENKEKIFLTKEECKTNEYFYELSNEKLTYKYCKSDQTSIEVYQESPILIRDKNDLKYIKANIGDTAFVERNGEWSEYYFHGKFDEDSWSAIGKSVELKNEANSAEFESKIIEYIPNAKDFYIRQGGGCYLANGDIYCWGKNDFKKVGIQNYGQLDTSLSPDYVNTPVMLRSQINTDLTKNSKWYNSPYRVKFEKIGMDRSRVCGITKIFTDGTTTKGGELYCNGQLNSRYYEGINGENVVKNSAILLKNKFNIGKNIYWKDIAMIEDVIAILSKDGDIYTVGRNYEGSLGIDKPNDLFFQHLVPTKIEADDSTVKFEKIFGLRDARTFGAIDSKGKFYIWGERNGQVVAKPTVLEGNRTFNPKGIFVNTNEFVLKDINNNYFKTKEKTSVDAILDINGKDIISISYFKDNKGNEYSLYVDNTLELKGTQALIQCKGANETSVCDSESNEVFAKSINSLNSKTNQENSKYANFTNVSIFKLDHQIKEIYEDFENNNTGNWKLKTYSDRKFKNLANKQPSLTITQATETVPDTSVLTTITERINPTKILGRFLLGEQSLENTYSFGATYADYEVEVELDFFEIDSWDMERFEIRLNGVLVAEDGFIHDAHGSFKDTNDSGMYTLNLGTHYNTGLIDKDGKDWNSKSKGTKYSKYNDQIYKYKVRGKLDKNGNLNIILRVRDLVKGEYGYSEWAYGQELSDESWGIDNVRVKLKETYKKFVCAMTGIEENSQMYCWGNVARSLPILSTSLFDASKISTINKLFITENAGANTQMSFDEYYNDGKLFLKYPTYINGFDYPFYFK